MTKEGGGGGELLGQVLGQPGSRPNYVNLLGTLSELPNFSGPLCPNKEHDRAGFVPPQSSLLCTHRSLLARKDQGLWTRGYTGNNRAVALQGQLHGRHTGPDSCSVPWEVR